MIRIQPNTTGFRFGLKLGKLNDSLDEEIDKVDLKIKSLENTAEAKAYIENFEILKKLHRNLIRSKKYINELKLIQK